MAGWKRWVMLALAACGSCTPVRHARPTTRVQAVPAAADRQLLRALALTVPVEGPISVTDPVPATGAPPPFLTDAASPADEQRAADCLAAAVYYEARSEPLDGQRAVAQVVLNRVRDRAFPASVCRVVYQRAGAVCQFTFACDGSTNHPIEPRAWAIAAAIARAALGGSVYAPVGSATHYHTTAILPWWASSLARIGTIGSHIFYRWSNRLGDALSFRQAYSGHESNRAAVAGDPIPLGGGDGSGGGAFSNEHGVTVHRGLAPTRPVAAAFGVRIHRGIEAPGAADVAPVSTGTVD